VPEDVLKEFNDALDKYFAKYRVALRKALKEQFEKKKPARPKDDTND